MAKGEGEAGLSAHEAKRYTKRARAPRVISEPATYTVIDSDGREISGGFSVIRALCPKVKGTTLHRRLANGERKVAELRKPANGRSGSAKKSKHAFKK